MYLECELDIFCISPRVNRARPLFRGMRQDSRDWEALTGNERHFISMVLAFFAASDGIVMENLVSNRACPLTLGSFTRCERTGLVLRRGCSRGCSIAIALAVARAVKFRDVSWRVATFRDVP